MLARIVVGILFFALGIVVIRYAYYLKNIFGSWGWAEKYLGAGGSYTAWKLFGLLLMMGGVLWATDTLGNIVRGVLGMFFVTTL